ncbi:hypothetical protein [Candidatus Stoquefichus massiliensis]|uniref:hypothetical protein n=1 Tax=Candidatus Stoquefichus massiliensis TaxID=1470350 RepID=UPI00048649C4|nr:hypothetical protein [Candidatus Stoquefichus massiliensis]
MKYVFIASDRDIDRILFNDVINKENVHYTYLTEEFTKLEMFFYRIHFSKKINSLFNIPFKKIWNKRYRFVSLYNKSDSLIFIYFIDTFEAVKHGLVDSLKKKYTSSKHISYSLDIHAFRNSCFEIIKDKFDKSYIFDESEAKRCKIGYYPIPYSKIEINNQYSDIKQADLFFVGYGKSRFNELIKIYEFCKNNKISTNFYILGIDEKDQVYSDDINYCNNIPYEKTIAILNMSNCGLELKVSDCDSYSQRVFETLFYNKKLLTNNYSVYKSKYFDKQSMMFFRNIDEINVDFVKIQKASTTEKLAICNELSPIKFLDFISND